MTKHQLKTWVQTQFKPHSLEAWLMRLVCSYKGCSAFDQLNDIVHHGCSSGCISVLIYYHDCVKFYARFEEEIWAKITDFRESTGFTMGQFLDGFNTSIDDPTSFKTSLAWFAVEHTAHHLLAQCLGENTW